MKRWFWIFLIGGVMIWVEQPGRALALTYNQDITEYRWAQVSQYGNRQSKWLCLGPSAWQVAETGGFWERWEAGDAGWIEPRPGSYTLPDRGGMANIFGLSYSNRILDNNDSALFCLPSHSVGDQGGGFPIGGINTPDERQGSYIYPTGLYGAFAFARWSRNAWNHQALEMGVRSFPTTWHVTGAMP